MGMEEGSSEETASGEEERGYAPGMVVYVGTMSSWIRGRGEGVAFCRRERG
jgi:hypothetical protein